MKTITDETKIELKPSAFVDGSGGLARQSFEVCLDGEPCGVEMHNERDRRGEPWIIHFTHPGAPDWKFSELRDALPLSEFKWERTK
jgi:hypothetical protein